MNFPKAVLRLSSSPVWTLRELTHNGPAPDWHGLWSFAAGAFGSDIYGLSCPAGAGFALRRTRRWTRISRSGGSKIALPDFFPGKSEAVAQADAVAMDASGPTAEMNSVEEDVLLPWCGTKRIRWVRAQKVLRRFLDSRGNITGEQHTGPRSPDTQHTGAVITQVGQCRGRMKHLELKTVMSQARPEWQVSILPG